MQRFLCFLALAAVLLSAAPVPAEDSFYVVPAGPRLGGPIMRLPHTITKPGYYYLTGNLTYSGSGDGITVASDKVIIDLKGFQLNGPSGNAGINLYDGTSGHQDVEVLNGSLSGWTYGVYDAGNGTNNRATGLQVSNCAYGISLGFRTDPNNAVTICTLSGGNFGICFGGTATGNTVSNCQNAGIYGTGNVSNNINISNCPTGIYVYSGSTVSNNTVSNCSGKGIYGVNLVAISNTVSGCATGISGNGYFIVNSVTTTAGSQTGISIPNQSYPTMVTGNTVSGPGTAFSSSPAPTAVPAYSVCTWDNTGF